MAETHLLDGLTEDEIVRRYQRWSHTVAYALGGRDNQEHEDLAQEALIGVWKAIGKHDPSKGAMASFVAEGGKLNLRDRLRRPGTWTGSPKTSTGGHSYTRRVPPPLPVEPLETDEISEGFSNSVDNKMSVRKAMRSLTEEQQVYLFLRFWCDMTQAEIQERVNGNVQHTWKLIREHMKRELGED